MECWRGTIYSGAFMVGVQVRIVYGYVTYVLRYVLCQNILKWRAIITFSSVSFARINTRYLGGWHAVTLENVYISVVRAFNVLLKQQYNAFLLVLSVTCYYVSYQYIISNNIIRLYTNSWYLYRLPRGYTGKTVEKSCVSFFQTEPLFLVLTSKVKPNGHTAVIGTRVSITWEWFQWLTGLTGDNQERLERKGLTRGGKSRSSLIPTRMPWALRVIPHAFRVRQRFSCLVPRYPLLKNCNHFFFYKVQWCSHSACALPCWPGHGRGADRVNAGVITLGEPPVRRGKASFKPKTCPSTSTPVYFRFI